MSSAAALPPSLPTLPAAPRRALVLATAAALSLHAVLLLGWPSFNPQVRAGAAHGSVTTRVIVQAPAAPSVTPPSVPEPAPPSPAPSPAAAPPVKPRPARPQQQAAPPAPVVAPPVTARGAEGGSDSAHALMLDAPHAASFGGTRPDVPLQPSLEGDDAQQALQFAASGEPLPTQVPRGATLHYQASGTLGGQPVQGETILAWRRADTYYEADWQSSAHALTPWRMASSGLIAAQGLLPVMARTQSGDTPPIRFDYAGRAVHFPATGDIPSAASADLPAGTQDALSAVIQLGAWLAGDASRFSPGQTFTLPVAADGVVRPWRWFVEPAEAQAPVTALGGKSVPAVRITHVPLGQQAATAPRVELWLSPALDHLPVRMVLTWPNGDTLAQVATSARLNRTGDAPRATGRPT